jgi:hypothetical protein
VDDAFADAAPIESAKNTDDTKPRIEYAGLKKRCARFLYGRVYPRRSLATASGRVSFYFLALNANCSASAQHQAHHTHLRATDVIGRMLTTAINCDMA